MRAMVYTAPLQLEQKEVAEPEAAQGQTIIDVCAAGICGSELEGFASQSPFRVPPLIMGHEFAGWRSDIGTRVAVNPLVVCNECDMCRREKPNLCRNRRLLGVQLPGAFAERVAVPIENCVTLPDDTTFDQGALVEPLANAVHALNIAREAIPDTNRVGVLGAGALGIAVTLVASLNSLEVVVADLAPKRLAIAEAAGALEVGTQLSGDFEVIFDCAGVSATRNQSLELLVPGGAAVWIGLHSEIPGFDARDLIRFEKRVLGTFAYRHDEFEQAVELASSFRHEWLTTESLDDGVEVFQALLLGPSEFAKVLLVP